MAPGASGAAAFGLRETAVQIVKASSPRPLFSASCGKVDPVFRTERCAAFKAGSIGWIPKVDSTSRSDALSVAAFRSAPPALHGGAESSSHPDPASMRSRQRRPSASVSRDPALQPCCASPGPGSRARRFLSHFSSVTGSGRRGFWRGLSLTHEAVLPSSFRGCSDTLRFRKVITLGQLYIALIVGRNGFLLGTYLDLCLAHYLREQSVY